MDTTIIVALVVAIPAMTVPTITVVLTGRQKRQEILDAAIARKLEKAEDYARQDEVARRADEAADKVAEVATQAADAARLLLADNKRVAAAASEAAKIQVGKLDQIHTLVNSNMTAAMQSELNACEATEVMMNEVFTLRTSAGQTITQDALNARNNMRAKISELRAALTDRLHQTVIANEQVEEAAQQ